MSFFEIENIKAVTGGQWIQRVDAKATGKPLAGVGIDTREDLANRAFIAIKGERHDGHSFLHEAVSRGAKLLIVEREPVEKPPNAAGVLKVDDTRRALGRLARAYRRTLKSTKVIAITGSSGKTTTKRMIHGVLSQRFAGSSAPKSFNNEIGVPLTILAASPRDRYIVVEIGTNAPGEIGRLAAIAGPDIAVITSIGRAHLERLGSIEGVAREKAALLSHLREDGFAIVTADSPELRSCVKLAPSVILFGEAADGDLRLTSRGRSEDGAGWWIEINGRARFDLALPGKHNALNAIAAVATARRMGVADERIRVALATLQPETMRFRVECIAGIDVYNDAYNANPESVAAALETFAELAADAPRRVVILGDMLELGADGPELHAEIGRHLIDVDRRSSIDRAILIGSLSAHAAHVLADAWPADRFAHVAELSPATMPAVLSFLSAGDSALIKGSRGASLERVVAALRAQSAAPVA